jgi:hypothetical protein
MKARMIAYKTNILKIEENGKRIIKGQGITQKINEYQHILPINQWKQNLWEGIQESAVEHFRKNRIEWHDQKDNLLSSQIACVNLFFPLRDYKYLLAGFLKKLYPTLLNVTDIDFEYIGPSHKNYFNESGGRGYSRTSSDVSIEWMNDNNEHNILLIEFKFTESSFGGCGKGDNKHQERCLQAEKIVSSPELCYRTEVKRPYWDMILAMDSPINKNVLSKRGTCPFKNDFYQLMRNQLFTKCLTDDKDAGFASAEFAICYDARNTKLLNLRETFDGEINPLKAWKLFLKDSNSFKHFTIQQLLDHIDNSSKMPLELRQWRNFLKEKYQV